MINSVDGSVVELFIGKQCDSHWPNYVSAGSSFPDVLKINYSCDWSSDLFHLLKHIFLSFYFPFPASEGKAMATAYDCKFIETSVGINHNVDELLVGLLTQIRLKLENPEKSRWDVGNARRTQVQWINFPSRLVISRDLFRKRSYRKSKRRACSPLGGTTCLSGNTGTNPSTPVGPCVIDTNTPPSSIQNRWGY